MARDVAIAGDDDPIPVPAPWFREAMAADDAETLIRLQARNYRMIQQRAAVLKRCLGVAAAQEPELAELYDTTREQRAMGTAMVVARRAELGAVANGSKQHCADTLYALSSPDVCLQLTAERGWTPARYERWLAAALQFCS